MRRRGFTLVELMGVVAMLGLFMLAASQLLISAIHILRNAQTAQEDASRYAALSHRLQGDVWGAARIETPDAATAALTRVDGARIVWTLPRDGGDILRTEHRPDGTSDASPARAPSVAIEFAAEGPSLVLRPVRAGSLTVGELRMTSQLLLAQGGPP